MKIEEVAEVRISPENELLVVLQEKGSASYQHIYREARGVHWDDEKNAFKSTEIKEWGTFQLLLHIRTVVRDFGIDLLLSKSTILDSLSETEASQISELIDPTS